MDPKKNADEKLSTAKVVPTLRLNREKVKVLSVRSSMQTGRGGDSKSFNPCSCETCM